MLQAGVAHGRQQIQHEEVLAGQLQQHLDAQAGRLRDENDRHVQYPACQHGAHGQSPLVHVGQRPGQQAIASGREQGAGCGQEGAGDIGQNQQGGDDAGQPKPGNAQPAVGQPGDGGESPAFIGGGGAGHRPGDEDVEQGDDDEAGPDRTRQVAGGILHVLGQKGGDFPARVGKEHEGQRRQDAEQRIGGQHGQHVAACQEGRAGSGVRGGMKPVAGAEPQQAQNDQCRDGGLDGSGYSEAEHAEEQPDGDHADGGGGHGQTRQRLLQVGGADQGNGGQSQREGADDDGFAGGAQPGPEAEADVADHAPGGRVSPRKEGEHGQQRQHQDGHQQPGQVPQAPGLRVTESGQRQQACAHDDRDRHGGGGHQAHPVAVVARVHRFRLAAHASPCLGRSGIFGVIRSMPCGSGFTRHAHRHGRHPRAFRLEGA